MKKIFITGTDTDVGKTVLSLISMRYFYKTGKTPFYFKPFQTGCTSPFSPDSDAAFICLHTPELSEADVETSVGLCLKEAKSPYYASKNENKTIDINEPLEKLMSAAEGRSPVIIEGAGGLNVPVTRNKTMIDVVCKWDVAPVIAARAGLGTINHTIMTINTLRTYDMDPLGVVFIEAPGAYTPEDMIIENMEAVEMITGIKPAGVIPPLFSFDHIPPACFQVMETLYGKEGM